MALAEDPVKGYGKPDGNITGVSSQIPMDKHLDKAIMDSVDTLHEKIDVRLIGAE